MPYVISRVGEQYNDEINELSDGTGKPEVVVLESEEVADAILLKMNIEAFAGVDLNSYSYKGFDESLRDKVPFLTKNHYSDAVVPKNATFNQLKKVYKYFPDIRFYFLTEVDQVEA